MESNNRPAVNKNTISPIKVEREDDRMTDFKLLGSPDAPPPQKKERKESDLVSAKTRTSGLNYKEIKAMVRKVTMKSVVVDSGE